MNQPRYNSTSIALHWLIAIVMIGTFCLGLYMQDLPLSPTKLQLYSWHKWAGIAVLIAFVLRLIWRLTHAAPKLPSSMSKGMQALAHFMHWLMYLLMFAIPLSGWLMSSAQGFSVVWFGIWPLPDLVSKDAALGESLKTLHIVLNYTFLVFLVAHIGAALKHHFIDKDTILSRMLPLVKPRSTGE